MAYPGLAGGGRSGYESIMAIESQNLLMAKINISLAKWHKK
jgi:hypothetical protein